MIKAGRVRIEGVVKRHGTTTVLHDANLDIAGGEFFVLLGPSGSGKTTTLRILAGLESVQAGRVLMDDRDVTSVEPGERDVAMVFQSYALYPHMTVEQNIGFPLKMIGTETGQIRQQVKAAADKVAIGHLLARRPGELSGGQQQRCALARAIVRQPSLFLLDEPLSNLDAKLRLETRLELRKLQRSLGVTTVYVTHDQEEAMTLADRIAVFMEGRIVQVGTPKEIFLRPASVAVAGFIGTPPMNLLPAIWERDQLTIQRSLQVTDKSAGQTEAGGKHSGVGGQPTSGGGEICSAGRSNPVAQAREVTLGIRPGDLRLAASGIAARVELIEDLGDSLILDLQAGGRQIKLKAHSDPGVAEGDLVHLQFDPADIHLFDGRGGQRL